MAEFPALPLWTDAYLGDTTHLNATEHGAYLLLLMTAWRSTDGTLPDDDKLLARYARCDTRQWKKLRAVIEPFFTLKNGKWRQGRLTDEREAVRQLRERQAAKGRASALKRKGRHLTGVQSGSDPAEPELNRASTSPTPTPDSEGKPSADERLQVDPVKELFDLGVSIMVGAGIAEQKARSLIGKWRKARSDAEVLTALLECRRQDISEPVEWLTKRLKSARYVSASGYEYRGDIDAVIRESERRADWSTHWRAIGDRDERKSASG